MNNHKRILIHILILTFGLLVNALAQQKEGKELTAEFDKMLSEQFKTNKTGATALVARNGQIIYKKAFGMANLELSVPMKVAPGTNWSYSNNGYFLLGYIIEKITGKTYPEYLEENVFKPLGMSR